MNAKRNFGMLGLLAFALLMALLAPCIARASEPPASAGTFTLPFETRWGKAVLPAGDYSYRLESVAAPQLISVTGQGQTVLVMTGGGISERKSSENSALIVVRLGRT